MTPDQDPLPESDFTWRRLYTWAVTIAAFANVAFGVYLVGQAAQAAPEPGLAALQDIMYWTIILAGIVVTYYMIAPSAEQIVRIIETARLLRQTKELTDERIEPYPDSEGDQSWDQLGPSGDDAGPAGSPP